MSLKQTQPTSESSGAGAARSAQPPRRTYFGLGLWNVFFIGEFALAYTGYLRLDLLLNAALFLFILIPVKGKWLHRLHALAAFALGFALLWSESWLPGPESILANKAGITGFSVNYVVQLVWDFINFRMIGWGFGVACMTGGVPTMHPCITSFVYGRREYQSANRIIMAIQLIPSAVAAMMMVTLIQAGKGKLAFGILLVVIVIGLIATCSMLKMKDANAADRMYGDKK